MPKRQLSLQQSSYQYQFVLVRLNNLLSIPWNSLQLSQLSTAANTSTSSALRYPWRRLRCILVPPISSNHSEPKSLSFFTHPTSMSSTTLFRFAARSQPSYFFRSSQPARRLSPPRPLYAASSATVTCNSFSTSTRRAADMDGQEAAGHHEESFEEFTARYLQIAPGLRKAFCASRHWTLGRLWWINWLIRVSSDTRKSSITSRMSLNYRYVGFETPNSRNLSALEIKH